MNADPIRESSERCSNIIHKYFPQTILKKSYYLSILKTYDSDQRVFM